MSEYQYFEFAAIERPLTRAEMAKLRRGIGDRPRFPAPAITHASLKRRETVVCPLFHLSEGDGVR